MTKRWQHVEEIYHSALALSGPERAAFVRDACGDDGELRQEVESLLAQAGAASGFLHTPAVDAAARLMTGEQPGIRIGQQIGVYRVVSLLGAGGMGEVYRARDTKLGRDVAIKVLPAMFTADRDRLARFEREARMLATLNHPHIGAIYGLEESDGIRALVLELVDGQTLAELLARTEQRAKGREQKGLPLGEALRLAAQIAEALDAAHERGIIHRDLKPANIKITPEGTVKVLDFGLAKAATGDGSGPDLSQSPTLTVDGTHEGMILGTAAYMSPEQARGKPVDKRTDIWAFGCVFYEMLTGQRAFDGEDVADTLSRVLQREPDSTALPETTPPAVRRLLARCLEKDRNKRLTQIAVAAFQIDEALAVASSGAVAAPVPIRSTRQARLLLPALVAGAIVGAAVIWLIASRPPAVTVPVTRLQMSVSPADEIGGTAGRPTRTAFALSPDGRTLVFSGVQKNQRALYARPLDQPTATMIPGTEGAVSPFFSPDGQWVGYWASAQLRKVPLRGGPSVMVLATLQIFGASWGDDDRIVFARGTGGLLEVSSAGGSSRALTTLNTERADVSHRLPHVLPGGDAVLFTVTHNRFPRWDETQVWLQSRSTGVSKLLIDGGADARYVSSGHLLYVREGALLAVPFDPKRLEVTGGAVGVVPNVMQAAYVAGQPNDSGAMQVSVSSSRTEEEHRGPFSRHPRSKDGWSSRRMVAGSRTCLTSRGAMRSTSSRIRALTEDSRCQRQVVYSRPGRATGANCSTPSTVLVK